MYNMIQIDIPGSIKPVNVADLRPTRQNRDIIAGLDRTTLVDTSKCSSTLRDSFFHRVTRSWNLLPYELRQSDTLSIFLTKLKSYLFSYIDIDNIL